MHCVTALLALRSLRKHRIGRYLPVVIIITGFLYPLTGGIITSEYKVYICSCDTCADDRVLSQSVMAKQY